MSATHQSTLVTGSRRSGTYDAPAWIRAWAAADGGVPDAVGVVADGREGLPEALVEKEAPVVCGNYITKLHAPAVASGDGDADEEDEDVPIESACAYQVNPDSRHVHEYRPLVGHRDECSKPVCQVYLAAVREVIADVE